LEGKRRKGSGLSMVAALGKCIRRLIEKGEGKIKQIAMKETEGVDDGA